MRSPAALCMGIWEYTGEAAPRLDGGSRPAARSGDQLFQKLKAELADAMTMCGVHTLDEISRDCLWRG